PLACQRYAMSDDFVNHVRLWRVKRRRVMTNVLSTKKDAISKIFEEHARLYQAGDRLKSKAADGLHLFIHFTQLRNVIGLETKPAQGREILSARVLLMCGL